MKKLLVLIVLVVAGYFIYTAITSGPKAPPGPRGVAELFLENALKGDQQAISTMTEESARPTVTQAAQAIKSLGMPADWSPSWNRMATDEAGDAYGVQMTGKGKVLVVEVNQSGANWLVHMAKLTDI